MRGFEDQNLRPMCARVRRLSYSFCRQSDTFLTQRGPKFPTQSVQGKIFDSSAHLDLLGWEEVPVVLKRARLCLLVVDKHLVLAVGLHDERVEVGVDVVLAAHLLLGQQVLALVFEDDVHLLGAGAADVWAEHDVVGAVTVHVGLDVGQ